MKKSILILAGAALLFGGCAKVENENNEVVPEKETHKVLLKASIADNTRVSADAGGVYSWQENDQITVFLDGTDGLHPTPFRALSSGSTTEFEGTILKTDNLGQYAFYPARLLAPEHSVSPLSFALASEYEYTEDATNMPMLGEIETNRISFKAVGGLLKIVVYNVPEDAYSLVFRTNKKITGQFPIEEDADENKFISTPSGTTTENNSITFNLFTYGDNDEIIRLRKNNMVFYIPLPVGTYTSLTFEFLNSSNESLFSKTASIGSGLSVERNQIIVAPALNVSPATVTSLWSEDFSGYNANEVPQSGTGYDGATITYSITDNNNNTKIYEESIATGTAPELLLGKSGDVFTASNIPTAGASNAVLVFLANNTTENQIAVSSTTEGVTIKNRKAENNTVSIDLAFTSSVTSFDLVFKTNTTSNVRLDNIVLNATIGSATSIPVISANKYSATIAPGESQVEINGVKLTDPIDNMGISAITDATWLSVDFTSGSFDNGAKLTVFANSYNHDNEVRTATVKLLATGAASKTITISQEPSLVYKPEVLTVTPGDKTFSISWEGDNKVDSYDAYYFTEETNNPATGGHPLSIEKDGSTFVANPQEELINENTYFVYIKAASLKSDYSSIYQIADEWASTTARPFDESAVPQSETIVFADLGLTNQTQYSSPFNGGHFTITFNGGSNDGKYYTDGFGIRTYGGGSFTIASTISISKIELIWDRSGDYRPTNDVASPSGYNTSTSTWTGESKSITFTRPSGNGQWRLKLVRVSYLGGPVENRTIFGMANLNSSSITQNDVTVTLGREAENASTFQNAHTRIYANETVTFSGKTIKRIEVLCTAEANSSYGPSCLSFASNPNSYSYSGFIGLWEGNGNPITLTATAQCRITDLIVTYE